MAVQGFKATRLANCMTGWKPTEELEDMLLPDEEFIAVTDAKELRQILRERYPTPDPVLKRVFKNYSHHYTSYAAVVTDLPATPWEYPINSAEFERLACLVDAYGPIWLADSYTDIAKMDNYKQSRLVAAAVSGTNGQFCLLNISITAVKRRAAAAKRFEAEQKRQEEIERANRVRREKYRALDAACREIRLLQGAAITDLGNQITKKLMKEGACVRIEYNATLAAIRTTGIRLVAPDLHLKNKKFKQFVLAWGDAPKEHRKDIKTEKWLIDAYVYFKGRKPRGLSKPRKQKAAPAAQDAAASPG